MPTCSVCDYRQDAPTAYCPSCGTPMRVRIAASPQRRGDGVLRPVVLTLLAVAVLVGTWELGGASAGTGASPLQAAARAVAPRPTPTAVAVTCQAAVDAVKALHPVFWSVMATAVGDINESCIGTNEIRHGAEASQVVNLTWQYEGSQRLAMYLVDASGAVSAGDTNAVKIDEAAKVAGPAALKALAGL